jgi:hypothetical protein
MGSPQTNRRALTGKYLLEGHSFAEAKRRAGYAKATARNQTFGAEECIAEWDRIRPADGTETSSQNLVQSARALLAAKIKQLLETPSELKRANISGIARLVEVTERIHGGAADIAGAGQSARDFGSRLAWLQGALEAYRAAGGTQHLVVGAARQTVEMPARSESPQT